jgi:hypothetical protein
LKHRAVANAEIFELGGYWYPNVGALSAPVVDITDSDLLICRAKKGTIERGLKTLQRPFKDQAKPTI